MERILEKPLIVGKKRIVVGCLASLALVLSACVDSWEDGVEDPVPPTGYAARVGVTTNQDCASIASWVAENAGNLPTSYEEVVEIPIGYRRAVFNALRPAARSSLWQQHFQAYLAAHPELSLDQRAFVEEMHAKMSPELFSADQSISSNEKRTAFIEAAERRAAASFPQSEVPGLLSNIGPLASTGDMEARHSGLEAVSCECNDRDDWCWNRLGGGYTCVSGASECDPQPLGCGRFWLQSCNGMCTR